MTSNSLVLCAIGTYLLAMLLIGVVSARRVQDKSDYIVAGRQLPPVLLTITIFATFFGGGTIMGVAGAAYSKGLPGVIADPFGAALCLLLGSALFFRALHRRRLLTIVDFFKQRYGPTAELLAGLCMIPPYVGWVASQFVAIGFVLNILTGIDPLLGMVIGAAVVVVYTTMGGLWAVAITDLFQTVVMLVGLLLLSVVVIQEAGGWITMLDRVPATHLEFLPANDLKSWAWYVQAWVVIGLGGIPAQDLIQRALSARSGDTVRLSGLAAGVLYLIFGMIPVVLGLAAFSVLPSLDNPELVVPTLATTYMVPWALALVMVAIISGIMSSVDSALLAPATVIGQNLTHFWRTDFNDRQVLIISRVAVVILAIVSLILALRFQKIYDIMVGSWSVLLVSLFVPLLAGLYWARASQRACVHSIVAGLFSWLLLAIAQTGWPSDLLATLIATGVFVISALLDRQTQHKRTAGTRIG